MSSMYFIDGCMYLAQETVPICFLRWVRSSDSKETYRNQCMCHFNKHARIQKVLSEGSKFDNVCFLVDEGIEDPNVTINGPSSAR